MTRRNFRSSERPDRRASGICRLSAGMAFDLQRTLQAVVEAGGSDLHLKVPAPPLMRVQGELAPIEGEAPYARRHRARAARDADLERAAERVRPRRRDRLLVHGRRASPASASTPSASAARSRSRCRVVPFGIKAIEELGLPEVVAKLADEPRGIILVTGHHRLGQVDDAGGDDRPDQPQLRDATSSRSRTRSSSCTATRRRSSTSARSASTPTPSRRRCAACCGRTPT